MPDNRSRIREVRDAIEALAPIPKDGKVSALALAKHQAVSAMWRLTAEMSTPGVRIEVIEVVCAEFAASAALYALAGAGRGPELDMGLPPAIPDVLRDMTPAQVAGFIRDQWEFGDSIGEFLYEFLGRETADHVAALTAELVNLCAEAKAAEPATATVAAADLQWALNFMSVDGSHTQGVKDRLTVAAGGHRDLSELRAARDAFADEAVTGK